MKCDCLRLFVSGIVCACLSGPAETVNFLATEDNDLANADNWSQSTWTSSDTLLVSTANFTMPDGGLKVSADMPVSAEICFGTMPNKNVTVDFGGYSLNTTTLRLGSMHDDNNRDYYLKATGGFTGVTSLRDENNRGHIRFYEGIYRIKNKIFMYNWFPYIYVCSGAHLIVEEMTADNGVTMNSDASLAQFVMDGGRLTVLKQSDNDYNWRRISWDGSGANKGDVQFLNGSVYEDARTFPASAFTMARLLIKDSAYYATNAVNNSRNTEFTRNSDKVITNSIFRTAQIYCGPYEPMGKGSEISYYLTDSSVDFCDSEVTLAFPPESYSALAARAGFALADGTKNNLIRIRGEKNRFSTQQFVLGGMSNRVEISGGAFAASNKLAVIASDSLRITVSNATAFIQKLEVSANATNSSITIAKGARVEGSDNFAIGGRHGTMTIGEGAVVDIGAKYLRTSAYDSALTVQGAIVTGSVHFAASDSRVALAGGASLKTALGPGWDVINPLKFEEGVSNCVLVISNSTYDCGSYFAKAMVTTAEGPKQDGVPFTNCPNCRIEFQGETPRFVVSSSKLSESNGRPWYGMALGEMIDRANNSWTTAAYPLKDPVRVRYVLPAEGYSEAPLQCLDNAIVLGGNAEFEFDASGYDWPLRTTRIPLIYNPSKYKGHNYRLYVNVEQLNETNADRLPSNPEGRKASLKMSDDGMTLQLVVPGRAKMVILIR